MVFQYKVKIYYLPSISMDFEGEQDGINEDDAKSKIIAFYVFDLSVDESDIEFVELNKLENG